MKNAIVNLKRFEQAEEIISGHESKSTEIIV